MSFAAIAAAVRVRFVEQVAAPASLEVRFDNGPPTKADGNWYRLTVDQMSQQLAEAGGPARVYRFDGTARVELYVPATKGDGTLLGIVDEINAAFRHVNLSSPVLHFLVPQVREGQQQDGWFLRVVEIPFWAEEIGP